MITSEEIAIVVHRMIQESPVSLMITGGVDYERFDYDKEDVIVVPHDMTGEGSVRYGVIKVNIHVPDIVVDTDKHPTYAINFPRLIEIRKEVIRVLKNHYEKDKGYSWKIGHLNRPIKEVDHDEHFVSIDLEITLRSRKF